MSRRCPSCGHHGHSSETCPNGDFKAFEVQFKSIRRSVSTGHLRRSLWSDYGDGYVSDGLASGRRQRKGFPKKPVKNDGHVSSQMPTELATDSKKVYSRQNSGRETRKELRSNLFDIIEDEDNFDANARPFLPKTESPTLLLPMTPDNHEAYFMRDGSIQTKGNDTMEDESPSVVVSDETETHPRTDHSTFKKVTLKWIFIITNFLFEVLSAIFDQLSSQRTPHFALIALLTSFATLVISVIEIVYKGRMEKVTWSTRGKLYWFYHPSPSHKPFGTFKDIFGLVCATCQFISAAISYTFYCLHVDNPIKISLISLVFAISLLCSNICNDHDKVALS